MAESSGLLSAGIVARLEGTRSRKSIELDHLLAEAKSSTDSAPARLAIRASPVPEQTATRSRTCLSL